jgi:hypothetical protein
MGVSFQVQRSTQRAAEGAPKVLNVRRNSNVPVVQSASSEGGTESRQPRRPGLSTGLYVGLTHTLILGLGPEILATTSSGTISPVPAHK